MKTVGIFEAKTKLSDICDEVARTGMSVMITRRGLALVRIEPIQEQRLTGHAPLEKLKEEVIALERIVNCSSIAIAGGEPLL